jgi:hypothetical protein
MNVMEVFWKSRIRIWTYIFIYWVGVEPRPLLLGPLTGLLYQSWMIDGDHVEAISGMNDLQGKLKYSEKTCTSAALSTTNPI